MDIRNLGGMVKTEAYDDPNSEGPVLVPPPTATVKMYREMSNGAVRACLLPVGRQFSTPKGPATITYYQEQGWMTEADFEIWKENQKAKKRIKNKLDNETNTEGDMPEKVSALENKELLMKTVLDQWKQNKRGELTSKEKQEALKFVETQVLPRTYEPEKQPKKK